MVEPIHTKILLADDHPIFRAGVRVVLERDPRFEVVAPTTVREMYLLLANDSFPLALVDLAFCELEGPALIRGIRQFCPTCSILVMSGIDEPVRVADMLRAGANGYAIKVQGPDAVTAAVESVLAGQRYLAPELCAPAIRTLLAAAALPLDRLTPRERRVFELLVDGKTNGAVAELLSIAPSTVEVHRRHIMQKLHARSIVDLVRVAKQHGLIRAA
jgi:DNA-binding NarL/FixJ family response regulator